MGAAPLNWLAKIGSDTLKTKAKLLSSAINELHDDGLKFSAPNIDNATFRYNESEGKFELLYKGGNTYSLLGWNDDSFSYDYFNGTEWVRKWDLNSNFNVDSGIMTSDNTMSWYRYGKIVIISIINCVPNTATQIATAPAPDGTFYAAVSALDLSASIWTIGDRGNVYLAVGDKSKQYTGQIVYICK